MADSRLGTAAAHVGTPGNALTTLPPWKQPSTWARATPCSLCSGTRRCGGLVCHSDIDFDVAAHVAVCYVR